MIQNKTNNRPAPNNSLKHYLAVENGCQWETIIVTANDKDEEISLFDVDLGINGSFLHSICSRELHFTHKCFRNDWYYGWTISEYEFKRIKELIDLYPCVVRYNKLLNN